MIYLEYLAIPCTGMAHTPGQTGMVMFKENTKIKNKLLYVDKKNERKNEKKRKEGERRGQRRREEG